MASTMTLAQLEAAVLQRADMVNSQFIAPAELDSYINQSAYEFYDLLVQSYGEDYFASTYQFTTDGLNELFSLPPDFYKMLGVDLLVSAPGSWLTIKEFPMSERNKYSVPGAQGIWGPYNMRYRIRGNQIWLNPFPTVNQSLRLLYVPRFVQLVNPTDTLDGVDGWTEYVIVDAAIKCLAKEESDVSVLAAQKQALIARVQSAAMNRDAGSPSVVADTRGRGIDPEGFCY